jgi:hypothetical protein
MRRLTGRRLADQEHGAVAVMTALLMVVLLGITAVVVDVGMVYFERSQLQNGADAAALAIAQQCAAGTCPDLASEATKYARANSNDGSARAEATRTGNTISVTTRTLDAKGNPAVKHWFAPIIGIDSTAVAAKSKASWGSPSRATVFPFTAPECVFTEAAQNTELWITSTTSCGPPTKRLPGAFGWLDETSKKSCQATVDVDQIITGEPGKSGPDCDVDGKTILLPVYDSRAEQGNNVYYTISGFAAFRVTAHSWPSEQLTVSGCNRCTGIRGTFITLVSLADLQSYGVEELGGESYNAFFVSLNL